MNPAIKIRALSQRHLWIGFAALIGVVIIAANAHFIYVAVASQPDCVPHDKTADAATAYYRAAKSGC